MTRSRRLVLALIVDLVLVAVEATGGVFAHSTGLVATAGHDLADAAALGLALVATRLALRPAPPFSLPSRTRRRSWLWASASSRSVHIGSLARHTCTAGSW